MQIDILSGNVNAPRCLPPPLVLAFFMGGVPIYYNVRVYYIMKIRCQYKPEAGAFGISASNFHYKV